MHISAPLISIIIPTYNRATLVKETLVSIIAQTYTHWECIIVDDGSTDNTLEVLNSMASKDERFKIHQRPLNLKKGPNTCRNIGFEYSLGQWVKWLDSDDLLVKDALKINVENSDRDVDVIVSNVSLVDNESKKIIKQNTIKSSKLIEDYLINNVSFYISGPLWNKNFLKKRQYLFDKDISNLDDWDFNLRMLYCEPKIVYIHESLIIYRRHLDSLSNEIGKFNLEEIKSEFLARKKHVKILEKTNPQLASVLKVYIIKRYKHVLRDALLKKNIISNKLFLCLISNQFRSKDFLGILKSFIGFLSFKLTNRGYKFFN